jgi:dienelactone hydrolase
VLQSAGYTCLAIDQRSGDVANDIVNETAKRAKLQRKPTEYLDAEQDMVAAINWLHERYHRPVILVGSSYSAGLALKIARTNEHVRAVAAFSPGEYYGKSLNLTATINGLNKPVFLTSSKSEADEVSLFMKVIVHPGKVQYIPNVEGQHGSKALWMESPGSEGYREAFWNWLIALGK